MRKVVSQFLLARFEMNASHKTRCYKIFIGD